MSARLYQDFVGQRTLDLGRSNQSEPQDPGRECHTKTLGLSLDSVGVWDQKLLQFAAVKVTSLRRKASQRGGWDPESHRETQPAS